MAARIFGRKVASAKVGGVSSRLLIVGHSHVAGEGSGASGGLIDAGRHGVAEKLAEKLTISGISAIRSGWMGDYNTSVDSRDINSFDSRISAGAGWSSYPTNIILGGRHLSQSGAPGSNGPLAFYPAFSFQKARIWFPTAIGLTERIGVYFDGALQTEVNQSHANSISSVDVVSTAPADVLEVKSLDGKPAFWAGVEFFPTVKPDIAISVAGGRGQRTADFVNSAAEWSALHGLEAFCADMTVIYGMTNDLSSNTPVATFKQNLSILAVTSVVRGNCIIVIDPPANLPQFWNGAYEEYAAAAADVANRYGCGLVDARHAFSRSWDRANCDGLMSDLAHPSELGHSLMADLIADEVLKFAA